MPCAAFSASIVARATVAPSCAANRHRNCQRNATSAASPRVAAQTRVGGGVSLRRRAVRAAAGDDNDDLFSFLNEQMAKEEVVGLHSLPEVSACDWLHGRASAPRARGVYRFIMSLRSAQISTTLGGTSG
jgi:hypothetical protein